MGFFKWLSNFLDVSDTTEKTAATNARSKRDSDELNSNAADQLETVRTRDPKGRFIKDDPDTPENEAFTTRKKKKKRKLK